MQYEYKIIQYGDKYNLITQLNLLGKEGWKVVPLQPDSISFCNLLLERIFEHNNDTNK